MNRASHLFFVGMMRRILFLCLIGVAFALVSPANGQTPSVSVHRPIQALPNVKASDNTSIDIVKLSYERPLIVIRFLGSLCSHCMQQIVAINKQANTLRTLDAKVIAFSNNPPSKCAEVTQQYHIDTTAISICSDTDNNGARALGASIQERDGSTTDLHAILVVSKGLVLFEHFSTTPLMSLQGVLNALASAQR